ncbi:MAG: HDOD domain-containing protein [Phycisphaeraceae bacterium]|nr:HDOD domain-containing protein [Phycisphaeraceae bacterium]
MTVIDLNWVSRQLSDNVNRVLNPSVCYRALEMMRDPQCNFSSIAKVLAGDPFISAKVVAVANLARRNAGSAESDPQEISSIDRAVAMLGVRQVQALVLAVMLTGPLAAKPYLTHRSDLWRYIFGCAAAGNWLIPQMHSDEPQQKNAGGEHMVCGLVLGLGALLLCGGLGAAYSQILGSRLRPLMLAQRERKTLYVDHHQVTLWALQIMRCPSYIERYPRALAYPSNGRACDEARAIELLGCRASGFQASRSAMLLEQLLPKFDLHDPQLVDKALPQMRKQVHDLARIFQLNLTMTEPQRDHANRQATLEAGQHLNDMVEQQAHPQPHR